MTEPAELLIDRGAEGRRGLGLLFEAHALALHRYAQRVVRSRDAADDLARDVFARLWLRWRRVDAGTSMRAHLHVAVWSWALDRLERRRLERRGLLRYAGPRSIDQGAALPPEGEARPRSDDVTHAVERILRTMPPRQREVAALRLRDQLTTAEIAGRLSISPHAVEVHIGRATRRLREQLPALLGEGDRSS